MKKMSAIATFESTIVDSERVGALAKALLDMKILFSIKADSSHSEIVFYDMPKDKSKSNKKK